MTPTRDPGAYSVGDPDRKGGAWWKWLLAALALLALLALLLLLLNGDDDDDSAARTTPTATQSADATGSGGGSGSLTAEGTSLLPVPGDDLSTYVGQQAEGQQVRVQSVVEDEGFFVGTSETDRVYVEYGGDVGEDESRFLPQVGDTVNLTGPVRPAPEDPAQTLRLDQADARLVEEQGGYVNADSVDRAS